jgi:hypothetical protein
MAAVGQREATSSGKSVVASPKVMEYVRQLSDAADQVHLYEHSSAKGNKGELDCPDTALTRQDSGVYVAVYLWP